MRSTTSLVRVVIQILVYEVSAATRVYKMVEADPRDSLFLHKIKDSGDILKVPFVDRESQAHLQPDILAVLDCCHNSCKCAGKASERVVGLLKTVQADTNVR